MTTRKAVEQLGLPPSADELHRIVEEYTAARAAHAHTYDVLMSAREAVVDALRRAGIDGFTL